MTLHANFIDAILKDVILIAMITVWVVVRIHAQTIQERVGRGHPHMWGFYVGILCGESTWGVYVGMLSGRVGRAAYLLSRPRSTARFTAARRLETPSLL